MASGVGTLVAAWQDGAEGEGQTIVLQRFNAQAKAVGREIRIPVPDGDGDLYLNDLRVAHGGDFSVTSIHYDRGLVQRGIRMHGFDVAGNPVR